jgi:hypothetical protein
MPDIFISISKELFAGIQRVIQANRMRGQLQQVFLAAATMRSLLSFRAG